MGVRPLLLVLTASLVIPACGPSLRRVHRASGYFEGCYAADLDPDVPDAERRACWQAWKRDYRVGADPERIDYVRERLAMLDPDRAAAIALATGDDGSLPMLDTPSSETETSGAEVDATLAPSHEVEPSTAETPRTPTPSEAAPPSTHDAEAAADARHERTRERHLHRGIVAPSSLTPSCPCDESWRTCAGACLADDHGCVGACRRAHTLCSRSCY